MYLLFKLKFLKAIRSVSLGRKIMTGIMLTLIGFIILSFILSIGFGLEFIVEKEIGTQDVIGYLNSYLIFFFLVEMLYRIFLQKVSAIELSNYLHLPVNRSKIIHFLLITSFISALNIVSLFLFGPFALTEIVSEYSLFSALSWLGTIIGVSWAIHWTMLWFKQKFGDNIYAIIGLFILILAAFGSAQYNIYNVGELLAPFLAASLESIIPLLVTIAVGGLAYRLAFGYYRTHAYLEELQQKDDRSKNSYPSIFGNLGLAGELADLELKLILRHKKSRLYLGISLLFVGYGLFLYTDSSFTEDKINFFTLFVGIFITGSFLINYGQFFLSWNSPYFHFFLSRDDGVKALISGKYLLFMSISLLCFILSIPYIYFGWEFLVLHLACFLFNVGINIHVIMYMGLWKPKPIDLQEGSLFSMEGVGAAQFLMGIPIILLPYVVFIPFSYISNEIGLAAIGTMGIMGLFFHKQLIQMHVQRLQTKRYNIATSFRQEL